MLKSKHSSPSRCYCEILQLAKMEGEQEVTCAINLLLETGVMPDKTTIYNLLAKKRKTADAFVEAPSLENYDNLLIARIA